MHASTTNAPDRPDWTWLSANDVPTLEAKGTHSASVLWLAQLCQWLHERGVVRAPARLVEPAGLPNGVFPICTAVQEVDRGLIGFLEIDGPPGSGVELDDDAAASVQSATDAVLAMLAPLHPDAQRPTLQVHNASPIYGTSLALPAALVVVAHLLQTDLPDDLVATGCWNDAAGGFEPVLPDTLLLKAEAARGWGYARMLVVEGQRGMRDLPIETIEVPADPRRLLSALLECHGFDPTGEAALTALATFDLYVARAIGSERDFNRGERISQAFGHSDDPLLRHLAADMHSRALLHVGLTAQADELARVDLPRDSCDRPDGILGDRLVYDRAAHLSMVQLDLGEWDDGHPDHAEVDSLIESIDASWPTRHQRLMRLILRNARARRHEYLGRRDEDAGLIARAWSDYTADADAWDELLNEYAVARLRLPEYSLPRQHNQCIDVLASMAAVNGREQFDWPGALPGSVPAPWASVIERLWPADHPEGPPDDSVPFDLLAWLKYHWSVNDGAPTDVTRRVWELVERWCGNDPSAYPLTSVYEWLMLPCYRDAVPRDACVARLRGGLQPHEGLFGSTSILCILDLRTVRVLEMLGETAQAPTQPTAGGGLARLHDAMLSVPERIHLRCPY
jgi:hypothetical protein